MPFSAPPDRGQPRAVCTHSPSYPDHAALPRLAGSSGTITLRCKDLKVLQLEIPGMEECLNIASSIEVSRARLQRVGRSTWLPTVFALGLPLTWVNTQLLGCVCTEHPRCQALQEGTGMGFAEKTFPAFPSSAPLCCAAGPVLGGLRDDDVPLLPPAPEPAAGGGVAAAPRGAVLPATRPAGGPWGGALSHPTRKGREGVTGLLLYSWLGRGGGSSPLPPSRLPQTTQWRLSDVNRDFAVCPTYPPAVIVPAAVSEETLRRAARFRQGGRFPVLSYYHSRNGTVSPRPRPVPAPPSPTPRRRCPQRSPRR